MKRFIITTLILAVSALSLSAQDGKYTLKNGNVTMTVNANEGGKIISFKYGEQEVLNQGRFPNSYGSTFWTSPQKEWNWPPVREHDMLPCIANQFGDKLVLASKLSQKIPLRIMKTFSTDEKDGSFVVSYTIKNESDQDRKVSPWEISRVPNDGIIFFEAPAEEIWPADLMKFESAYGLSWYSVDTANENRKVNCDGKGWLAYASNGLLLVKRFQDIKKTAPAPDEAEIQVYVNVGKTYIELESQGAYTNLKPGETLTWTVKWFLVPTDAALTPNAALASQAKKLGHSKF